MNIASLLKVLGLFAITVNLAQAADTSKANEVSLSIKADREQALGWPLIVDLTVTNAGKQPISWWCGGPDLYPGAEHFVVEVRYGSDTTWHKVPASNGQYVEGSGFNRLLAPGEKIVVPLAVSIELLDSGDDLSKQDGNIGGVSMRITPREWHAATTAETHTTVWSSSVYADRQRSRAIKAILESSPPLLATRGSAVSRSSCDGCHGQVGDSRLCAHCRRCREDASVTVNSTRESRERSCCSGSAMARSATSS